MPHLLTQVRPSCIQTTLSNEKAQRTSAAARMTEQHSKELADARIARRLFETALATCDRLPDAERDRLLKEMAKLILQRIEKDRSAAEPRAVRIVGVEIK
jgi:hypothetical protein